MVGKHIHGFKMKPRREYSFVSAFEPCLIASSTPPPYTHTLRFKMILWESLRSFAKPLTKIPPGPTSLHQQDTVADIDVKINHMTSPAPWAPQGEQNPQNVAPPVALLPQEP